MNFGCTDASLHAITSVLCGPTGTAFSSSRCENAGKLGAVFTGELDTLIPCLSLRYSLFVSNLGSLSCFIVSF